jgi:hypothetical protein
MDLKIVNPEPRYGPVQLIDPPPYGYVHVAASVAPPRQPGPPILPRSEPRQHVIARLRSAARELENLDTVDKVTVYRASILPPPNRDARQKAPHVARYDVAALIETTFPDVIGEVRNSDGYRAIVAAANEHSSDVNVMAARCVRRVGDVDKTRQGTFLFNYFYAEDSDLALRLWEYLAGWYAVETRMDNSTLLQPVDQSTFTFVNHARWDNLPLFAFRQFAKRTFYTYMLANLRANNVIAMPILYRLA